MSSVKGNGEDGRIVVRLRLLSEEVDVTRRTLNERLPAVRQGVRSRHPDPEPGSIALESAFETWGNT